MMGLPTMTMTARQKHLLFKALPKALQRRGLVSLMLLSLVIIFGIIRANHSYGIGASSTVHIGADEAIHPPLDVQEKHRHINQTQSMMEVALDIKYLDPNLANPRNIMQSIKTDRVRIVTKDASSLLLDALRTQIERPLHMFALLSKRERCIVPLSKFQEKYTRFDDDIVLLTSGHEVTKLYKEPPHSIAFWNLDRKKWFTKRQKFPNIYCKSWISQIELLMKLYQDRTFYVSINEKPELNYAIEKRTRDALIYFGWKSINKIEEASVVINGGWDWSTMFSNVKLGKQLIMRHPMNPNLTTKDLLFHNLKMYSKSDSCFSLFKYIPETYLADDPKDCATLKSIANGKSWYRKVGDLHMGTGIQIVTNLKDGDCEGTHGDYKRNSKVVYQRAIDPLLIGGKKTSLRLYMLIASYDPLVAFFNFHSGHLYIAGNADQPWYTQHKSFEAWTFERFDEYMEDAYKLKSFFSSHIYKQSKEIVAWALRAAKDKFKGARGHFDLLCLDFILSKDLDLFLLEMSDGCLFKDYTIDQVKWRMYLPKDSLEVVFEVQKAVLSDNSVLDIVNMHKNTFNEQFEMLYSNQKGAEYEYLASELTCRA